MVCNNSNDEIQNTVKTSCPYPPSVTGGFFIAKGVVNHAYVSGTTVKYYCDTGHHPKGPIVLTCSGKEWIPKELPACLPVETSLNGKLSFRFSFSCLPLGVSSLNMQIENEKRISASGLVYIRFFSICLILVSSIEARPSYIWDWD